ncbi:MAG TPA: ribose 5-phosphate isomerase B [bacterium]|nr:ribose 5-phosphate isomerase B [bacterium]
MMIYISSDHAGFEFKKEIKEILDKLGYEHEDLGPETYDKKDDYPDYAFKLSEKVITENGLGILTCDTGVGMSIAANKVKGVRAALVTDMFQAKRSREHENSNILILEEENHEAKKTEEILKTWLEIEFTGEERHVRRLKKISDYENK